MKTGKISEEEKDIIFQMRNNNAGYGEIAKILNCSKHRVLGYCHSNNLEGFKGKHPSVTSYGEREERFRTKFNISYEGKFEYVSGYTNNIEPVNIKCSICGHIQERNASCLRNNKELLCDHCNELKRARKCLVSVLTKRHNDIVREQNKSAKNEIRLQKLKEREITKICVECGKQFTTTKDREVCCSDKCKKKKMNCHRDRRLKKCDVVDRSITLTKLVKRDKGICHICGKKVDMTADSNSGRYGSIDHVKAIANGGNHTWNNVKLAHRSCNTHKRAKVIYETSTGQLTMAT